MSQLTLFLTFNLIFYTVLSEISAAKIINSLSITNTNGDYTHFPGIGSYKLYTKAKNWNDARKHCHEDGAHLVIINSREEELVLTNMLKKENEKKGRTEEVRTYVGIHDIFKEGEWVTIFDEPLEETGYTPWVFVSGKKQPDNHLGKEHCGSFTLWYHGGYNDVECRLALPYICELPYSSVLTLQGIL